MDELINVAHGGKSLQMRPDQMTISVLSKAFHLIPETLFLVSERGTIAVAENGVFEDVESMYSWTVEGEKATSGDHVGYPTPIRRKIAQVRTTKPHSQRFSKIESACVNACRLSRSIRI